MRAIELILTKKHMIKRIYVPSEAKHFGQLPPPQSFFSAMRIEKGTRLGTVLVSG